MINPEIFGVSGGVEAVIQGEQEKVEKMVELLKQGPPVSRVEQVEVFWETPKENFDSFEIKK
jgi:Acylphosphatases